MLFSYAKNCQHIDEINAFLNSITEELQTTLANKIYFKIKLILEELALNAWHHGYDSQKSKLLSLKIEIEVDKKNIKITIFDNSKPFDPTLVDSHQQKPEKIGNNGLKLVANFASSWVYKYINGLNVNSLGVAYSVPFRQVIPFLFAH